MKNLKTRIFALTLTGIFALTINFSANAATDLGTTLKAMFLNNPTGFKAAFNNSFNDSFKTATEVGNQIRPYVLTATFIATCCYLYKKNQTTQPKSNKTDAAQETTPPSTTPSINIFELAQNKTSTHITVKKGEDFTIAAPRTGNIEANYLTPYISEKVFKTLPGEQLEDKDSFRFTALKKGYYELYIEQQVRFEEDKPCARIDHDIIVHVE